jgi:hypothetical protein
MSNQDEVEQAQNLKKQLIDAKKNRLVTNEPLLSQQEIDSLKPKTFKKKWENYWYYNKLKTLGVLIVIILVGLTIYSVVTRPKFDYNILIVTTTTLDKDKVFYEQAFKAFGKDLNVDGKVTVTVLPISFIQDPTLEQKQHVLELRTQLANEIVSGQSSIFITDDYCYNLIQPDSELEKSNKLFTSIKSIVPNSNILNDRFYIKDTDFSKTLKFKHTDDISISIRPTEVAKGDKKLYKQYQEDTELIKRIIMGEKTNEIK